MKLGDVVNPDAAHWGKPLDGVRVLSLEQMQALPFATQLLGRLGADVVKVEAPGTGDLGRSAMPAMTDPEGRPVGATFMRNNLSKRSVVIDLKAPAGRDLVLRLAPRFDVVAENFRAGAAERLRLVLRRRGRRPTRAWSISRSRGSAAPCSPAPIPRPTTAGPRSPPSSRP